MTAQEILKQLSNLTPHERLEIAEAAMRLTREQMASSPENRNHDEVDEDAILNVAGCLSGNPISATEIEQELYGR
jgi:hypothetical protein